jgi:hypothetical protein
MSFLNNLKSFGKKALGFIGGDSIGGTLARTALLGYALNRVLKSANKGQEGLQDQGTQITISPDTNYSVPVLYGSAFVPGKIIDVHLEPGNKNLWVAVVFCEKTGNLIDGTASAITFEEAYIDNFRLGFDTDGVTVKNIYDDDNNDGSVWNGLIKVYPFNNGSTSPVSFASESTGNTSNAYDIFPSWNNTKTLDGLAFALIRFTYNKKQKLTTVGQDIKFKLSNSMTQPGDCLNDYLQNTRYGAGVPSAEIDIQ